MQTSQNILALCAVILFACSCSGKTKLQKEVTHTLRTEILVRGKKALTDKPVTVTSFTALRSAGGIHDFYSEGDYWWPNPEDPEGPYIRRDGESNPDNFVAHRHAMIRFSQIVGDLTSAWMLTNDSIYAKQVIKHVHAWFIDPNTRMNPNLLYAQAIKGIITGRGIGIIDTIHLLEVVQSLIRLEEKGMIPDETATGVRRWLKEYVEWLTTHPYGLDEMKAKNNHGTCWVLQVAQFARYIGDTQLLEQCRERFKTILLTGQMGEDGSFPLELSRTKPYGYSLFNLDAMATLCHILSTPEEDLWEFTVDNRNMQKAVAWHFPYIQDKSQWPYPQDVMFWEEWPVAPPALLFSVYHTCNKEYLQLWKQLPHFPENEEVVRNLPVRHPLLWI
ncbi:alginate lyase family protein [Parabacteroides sp. OttesenSCG-928-K15]|nr:alginate lyase family protein [Parabacteroides sp. OttesenSCG-928-K15]